MDPNDTLEGSGLPAERQKFQRARWQFKIHLFGPDDDARLSAVSRVVRTAWEGITRCHSTTRIARSTLCVHRMRNTSKSY